MPAIPVYSPQVNIPGQSAGVPNFTGLSQPFAQSISQVGRMLQHRGEQIVAEYDSTKAYSAFTNLRDKSRVKMTELLSREGSAAMGVQDEYSQWYAKERGKIDNDQLTVGAQRDLYGRLADHARMGDLNSLAGHEAQQQRVFKKQTIDGLTGVLERDIRNSAFDDGAMDSQIAAYFDAMDRMYPGSDKTADKLGALQVFRSSAMKELIDKNPKYAAEKLEQWKPDLGDKYDVFKKQLEGAAADDKLSAVYGELQSRFGSNHERAMSFLAIPANQKAMGLSFKDVNQLHSRFSQLLADRERSERIAEHNVEQIQKQNANAVLQSLYNPNAPKVDVHELHKRRLISDSTYETAIKARESTTVDNPYVISELHDLAERGVDISGRILDEVNNGNLSERSAASIGKHVTDEKSKRAMQYIDRALKPSAADQWSPDKHVKYADATRMYYALVQSGMDYEQAAYQVVKSYVDGVRRTWKQLPTPEGLSPEDKKDILSLQKARERLIQERATMAPGVYRERMNSIDALLKLAREAEAADDTNSELNDLLKKRIQK